MSDSKIELQVLPAPRGRLKFIDMARSIAILLMLEGHFIDLTLMESFRDPNNSVYIIWHFIRGFTAPMFFTVTGVVFVYLLTNNKDAGFWKNKRVRKGFKRSFELLFWGYLLQMNVLNIFQYLQGNFSDWIVAFHVLQCIGVGISALLLIFGLYKWIGKGALVWYYFLAGTLVFAFYPYFKQLPEGVYAPHGGPQFIQNLFKGPNGVFPIIPWMAFTLYGGMVGALLHRWHKHVKKVWFPLIFILLGLALNLFGWSVCKTIDELFNALHIHSNLDFVANAWLYGRVGQVLIVLGILMFIEKYFHIKDSLFLQVGQNTLPIYVIHVVVLYSGIFGYGLNHLIAKQLTPWQSVLGAIGFILIFVILIKFYKPIEALLHRVKEKFTGVFKKLKFNSRG
jgi:uncharacterized membrane protein